MIPEKTVDQFHGAMASRTRRLQDEFVLNKNKNNTEAHRRLRTAHVKRIFEAFWGFFFLL